MQTATILSSLPDYTGPAKPEELNYQLAYQAHSHISFSPDERAKSDQQSYAEHVNELYFNFLKNYNNPEQKAYLDKAIEEYKAGYLAKFGTYLSSLSGVASSMITGPANFPTGRNQKRSKAADNRHQEFIAWRDTAIAKIRNELLSLRTIEQINDHEWLILGLEIKRSLGIIQDVDQGKAFWSRPAFVNSINGMVKTRALKGEVAIVEKALSLVTQYNNCHDKPAIGPKHKFWTLLEVAQQVKSNAAA